MKLIHLPERADWQERFEKFGFAYHSYDGSYWHDDLGVSLTQRQWDDFGRACEEIHQLGLDIVSETVRTGDFAPWKLTDIAASLVTESWRRADPSVYGRFDLTLDAHGIPKIYEYNGDTPTSIMEASWAQTDWANARGLQSSCRLAELMPSAFAQLTALGATSLPIAGMSTSVEDTSNLFPMVQWARQAGLDASWVPIESMQYHFDQNMHGFDGIAHEWIFKLYPWEFLCVENAQYLPASRTRFVEPAWKLLLSSKAFLAEAWRRAPGHPNLLACYHAGAVAGSEGPGLEQGYAKKPLYSREGSNVTLVDANGSLIQKEIGPYGREGYVVQAYCPMPEPEPGKRFTLGGWISAGRFAGTCARFTDDHVVTNVSWTCGCHIE